MLLGNSTAPTRPINDNSTNVATTAYADRVGRIVDVTTVYTAAGAIATSDLLSLINSASTIAMTLANGGASPLQIDIHNYGTGQATVTAKIEGATTTITLPGNPAGASLALRWLPSLTTWIIR